MAARSSVTVGCPRETTPVPAPGIGLIEVEVGMPDVSFENLLVVFGVAVVVPLLLGGAPRLRVPSVVLEILVGVLIGPSVLGWVEVDLPVQILALFGLAFLLFLAGLEIDLGRLRGRVLRLASLGYLITVLLGLGVGAATAVAGWVRSPVLVAITLSATSLGLVVAVLKDAGGSDGALGQLTIAAASVADFGAIVLLTLFFSTSGGSVGQRAVLLVLFAGLVGVAALLLLRVRRSRRIGGILERLQDTTAEIRVRISVLLMIVLVVLASRFGLETILGAFLAGALVGLVDRDASSHPRFRAKLDAIGYGFLIPIFFVSSGVRLDLRGLLENPSALTLVPLFLAALLVVRGIPALLWAHSLGGRETAASALLQATSLPFIVTATQIGTAIDLMSPVTAAALVCAGLLSVAVFPAVALAVLRGTTVTEPVLSTPLAER
jgi:Kef-type K+ transport system membrane component KefB